MHLQHHPSLLAGTSQASPSNGLEQGGGGTGANILCVDPTRFAVPTRNPFAALHDTSKNDNNSHDPPANTRHVYCESTSCFAVAAYVQETNMTPRVFTHSKSPRPPHTKAQAARPEGQHAQSEEPTTYPHAAHIPMPIDIKHALSAVNMLQHGERPSAQSLHHSTVRVPSAWRICRSGVTP
jgi:hypothetical protein